jgi:hypothetical protein
MVSRCAVVSTASDDHTFIPCEVPSFELGLFDVKVLRYRDWLFTLLGDSELEVGVGYTRASLRAVDGRVNLQSDIEILTGKKIRPTDKTGDQL